MDKFPYTSVITAVTGLQLVACTAAVGRARFKYGVNPPATTGNPNFERYFRVQMNQLEQTAIFLPAIWLFAQNCSDLSAGIIGSLWAFGRVLYALGYYKSSEGRIPGHVLSAVCTLLALFGGTSGAIRRALK
eukprot:NODE_5982_length_618_cov_32.683656_g5579_i0.p1 GENE.NODE_5982_length_618_cov_32.683656_g5579_i0~~NODE_5982_length_618_cov_32.683656_g5579_i0.p1  ORF type:complete len:132 (+),score=16.49 NODE_5982_length_618_cov_32.683656_g5579_i0:58-453(+)